MTRISQGSEHGTAYFGFASARHLAPASALACCLTDRSLAFPPVSQSITRRRWVAPGLPAIDESGARFL